MSKTGYADAVQLAAEADAALAAANAAVERLRVENLRLIKYAPCCCCESPVYEERSGGEKCVTCGRFVANLSMWQAIELWKKGLARIAELEAVVGRLPLLADEEVAVPGAQCYWTGEGYSARKRAEVQSGDIRMVGSTHANVDGSYRSLHSLFSTESAARAAAEQGTK
jgi:hypothetical protein